MVCLSHGEGGDSCVGFKASAAVWGGGEPSGHVESTLYQEICKVSTAGSQGPSGVPGRHMLGNWKSVVKGPPSRMAPPNCPKSNRDWLPGGG